MNKNLEEKLIKYYTKYYRDDCSLSDYKERTGWRLHEETVELGRMQRIEKTLELDLKKKKHFIVGAGTGGLAIVLYQEFQSEVYGIEPSPEELEIIQLKCQEAGINPQNFKAEHGEKLSAPDNSFDFVHCITVLEHVQNVNQCINEMIRVVKPGGKIYINTPNYAYSYEGHYKTHLPTFSKTLSGLILRLSGRSDKFLKTINFLTAQDLDKVLFKKSNIAWQRIYEPLSKSGGNVGWWLNYLKFKRGIYPTQEIIITKLL